MTIVMNINYLLIGSHRREPQPPGFVPSLLLELHHLISTKFPDRNSEALKLSFLKVI